MSKNLTTTVASKTKSVEIHRDNFTVIIGERINPTGKKDVKNALRGVFCLTLTIKRNNMSVYEKN